MGSAQLKDSERNDRLNQGVLGSTMELRILAGADLCGFMCLPRGGQEHQGMSLECLQAPQLYSKQ